MRIGAGSRQNIYQSKLHEKLCLENLWHLPHLPPAKGHFNEQVLGLMNAKMISGLAEKEAYLDDIFMCLKKTIQK